jgi:hypothetical protein
VEPLKPIEPPFEPRVAAEWPQDAPPGNELPGGSGESGGAHNADPDFELLESYLDGELLPGETRRLERRLVAEPELSAALSRMSAEYSLRRAAFRSLEPDDRTAKALSESVVRSVQQAEGAEPRRTRPGSHRRSIRIGRIVGALAACVAISFCAGWIGRGYASQAGSHEDTARNASDPKDKAEPSVYQVALTDEAGHITAIQKFDTLEEAQNFAADVGRLQARQQLLRRSASAVGNNAVENTAPVPTSSGL